MENKKFPETLEIVGVTFQIKDADALLEARGHISQSDYENQEINIKTTLPNSRRLSYLLIEIGHDLLSSTGISKARAKRLREPFGRCLFQLVKDNSFDWLYNKEPTPCRSVIIHGLRYRIIENDAHLDDCGLSGEIDYRNLTIAIHSSVSPDARNAILVHEIVHGLLYESGCVDEKNDEKLVEPLGHFLYQLLTRNDFSFAYAGGSATLYDF